MTISTIIAVIQIILSVLLVITILLQRSEAGLGGAFGGGDMGGGVHYTRRGAEKFIFRLTIVLAILFALSAVAALMVSAVVI